MRETGDEGHPFLLDSMINLIFKIYFYETVRKSL